MGTYRPFMCPKSSCSRMTCANPMASNAANMSCDTRSWSSSLHCNRTRAVQTLTFSKPFWAGSFLQDQDCKFSACKLVHATEACCGLSTHARGPRLPAVFEASFLCVGLWASCTPSYKVQDLKELPAEVGHYLWGNTLVLLATVRQLLLLLTGAILLGVCRNRMLTVTKTLAEGCLQLTSDHQSASFDSPLFRECERGRRTFWVVIGCLCAVISRVLHLCCADARLQGRSLTSCMLFSRREQTGELS